MSKELDACVKDINKKLKDNGYKGNSRAICKATIKYTNEINKHLDIKKIRRKNSG